MELLSGDRLGKYEIVGRLAAGGMAEVYLARSIGVGGFAKTVALKRMLPDLAQEPGYREMFMHEASIVSRLNHANIVQIFDFAEERGELYLTMEFVHGVTLRQLLRDVFKPPAKGAEPGAKMLIPPMLAAHIGRGIARALAHAWQVPDENGQASRLIHRDVSPHNVLLSYDGDVKLADFGIAKPADRRTSVGTIKGKLVYMAPEQITGGTLDARTDVFALGIVLYETATNRQRALFEGANQREIMQAIHKRQIPPPDRMDPDFPKSFSDVILKALEREPSKRYQSAAELADALGACIHKEARSPQEVDVSAFMRQVYGEPPPVRGLRPISQPPAPAAAEPKPQPTPGELELARRADDPHAETLLREQAEALGKQVESAAAPSERAPESGSPRSEKPTRATIRERRPARLMQPQPQPQPVASPEAANAAPADRVERASALPGRRRASTAVALAAFGAAVVVLGAMAVTVATKDTGPAGANGSDRSSAGSVAVTAAAGSADAGPPQVELAAPGAGGQAGAPRADAGEAPPLTQIAASAAASAMPVVKVAGAGATPATSAPAVVAAMPATPLEKSQPAAAVHANPGVTPAAAPVVRKPVRKVPVGKGSLWVQVTPWAFVAIDNGKKVEVAPAKLFDGVPAGVRTIELSNDAGFSRKLKVVVKANERARLIGTIQDARQVP